MCYTCVFQIAIYCLPYIQSCLNPVIYSFMSKRIRQSFKTSLIKHINSCTNVFTSRKSGYEAELKSSYSHGLLDTQRSVSDRNSPRIPECSL